MHVLTHVQVVLSFYWGKPLRYTTGSLCPCWWRHSDNDKRVATDP